MLRVGVVWVFDMLARIRSIPSTSRSPLVSSCWSAVDETSGDGGDKGICGSATGDVTITSR